MFRYILEPYKGVNTRYICPECKMKTFVRYLDIATNQHIGPNVGKCNRLKNCGYHLSPKQYFQENKQVFKPQIEKKEIIRPKTVYSLIPEHYFLDGLKQNKQNNFTQFLLQQFGKDVTDQLISKYFIGSSKHWPGATIFWQIDRGMKIRTGKIMLYNANTGKRIKEPYPHITWVHSLLKISNTKQCLFGEHLLSGDLTKPIAIVESEKTAIVASIYLPQFIWLACGSANNLTFERCKVLEGRKVVLYPDLNCFDLWSQKANELSKITHFAVSNFLEEKANEDEKKQGLDIADYLILVSNQF